MRTCPSCGLDSAGRGDFCSCGEYLRWEPTQHLRAVAPAAERVPSTSPDHQMMVAPAVGRGIPPARSTERRAATLVLSHPGQDDTADGSPTASVDAGGQAKLVGTVRNESDVVDHYELSVRGLPQGWWTISPATLYLVPYGTGDAYEDQIEIDLHPPRTAEALAKDWPIEVSAVSRTTGTEAASARATLRIASYQDLAAKIGPDRASGRLKARYLVTLRNRANAPVAVSLEGRDGETECRFRFAATSMTLEAGKGVQAPVTVFPHKQIWLGRPKDHAVTVTATPDSGEQGQLALSATFRQRSWLPRWLSTVAPLAAVAAAAVVLLLPKQVLVPNLVHAPSVFAAEKAVVKAGLKLSGKVDLVQTGNAPPGSIVDQAPAPRTKVKRGSTVQVEEAVGPATTTVPDVTAQTTGAADEILHEAHLALGVVSPQPPNPKGTIVKQTPAAGAKVKDGTAVAVVLTSNASPHKPASSLPVLPATITAAAAVAELSKLGFAPTTVHQLSSQPAGQLIATNPPSGSPLKPGASVQVIESAGYPEITYDDGSKVHVVSGASGDAAGKSPPGQDTGEASWSPDGKELAYVQGASSNSGQLMLFAAGQQGAQPEALTGHGSNVRDPSFAPNGQLLAFVDRSQGIGRLCFATVGAPAPINTNDCTSHAGFDLGGQISWSPDGRSVLVLGVSLTDASRHGLVEFHTSTPFSPNSSAWDQGSLVTQPSQDVIAGAFSPDGKHLALISDFNQPSFHLFTAPANQFDISKAKMYAVAACQVSWRSDSQAVAVMQSASGCAPTGGVYPTGTIVTISLADANQQTIVGANGENPSWQPVSLGG